MPPTTRGRRFLPSMPRDHFQRKRVIRRIGTTSFIIIFSIVVAYVLTRPVGGTGFSLPKYGQSALPPVSKSHPALAGNTPAQATPVADK